MNEMKPEDVMRALDLFHQRMLATNLAEQIYEQEVMAVINARYLILKYKVELADKDAEIERLQGAVKQYEEERKYHFAMSRKRIDDAITEFAERLKSEVMAVSLRAIKDWRYAMSSTKSRKN